MTTPRAEVCAVLRRVLNAMALDIVERYDGADAPMIRAGLKELDAIERESSPPPSSESDGAVDVAEHVMLLRCFIQAVEGETAQAYNATTGRVEIVLGWGKEGSISIVVEPSEKPERVPDNFIDYALELLGSEERHGTGKAGEGGDQCETGSASTGAASDAAPSTGSAATGGSSKASPAPVSSGSDKSLAQAVAELQLALNEWGDSLGGAEPPYRVYQMYRKGHAILKAVRATLARPGDAALQEAVEALRIAHDSWVPDSAERADIRLDERLKSFRKAWERDARPADHGKPGAVSSVYEEFEKAYRTRPDDLVRNYSPEACLARETQRIADLIRAARKPEAAHTAEARVTEARRLLDRVASFLHHADIGAGSNPGDCQRAIDLESEIRSFLHARADRPEGA